MVTPVADGEQGPKGEKGAKGELGLRGETGDRGMRGPEGQQGIKGDTGDEGETSVDCICNTFYQLSLYLSEENSCSSLPTWLRKVSTDTFYSIS